MTTDGVNIPCPQCGKKRSFTMAEFKTQAELEFTCLACEAQVTIENDLPRGLDEINKEIDRLLGKEFRRH